MDTSHPVYQAARTAALEPSRSMAPKRADGTRIVYIDAAATARLIRSWLTGPLGREGIVVRTSRSSLSSAVDVYLDPEVHPVSVVDEARGLIDRYSGRRFDGTIDLEYSVDSWLMPDGKVEFARTLGTTGSRGVIEPRSRPTDHDGAILVHFLPWVSVHHARWSR